jgi:SPOR domain
MAQYHKISSLQSLLLLAVAMTLLFQFGCSSTKKSTPATKPRSENMPRETKESSSPGTVMNEDFDPMTLKAPEFRIERKQVAQRSDTVTISTAVAPVDTSWQTVPGFQVQLLQTEDAKLGRAAVRDAILALNTDIEIIYEAPYYKVRAGRFTNRYDAEQLQNLASEKGYANCWVVRTQIKVRASDLLNQK